MRKPIIRDPVSGQKMQKGKPVEAAYSKAPKPDDGPMAKPATKGVPSQKSGFESNVYTPNPKKPHIQRFKQSKAADEMGVTGRVVNPSGEPAVRGALEKDAMRRGRPVEAAYSGDAKSQARLKLDQFGEGLKRAARGGRGPKK